jgi:hypothetical protein
MEKQSLSTEFNTVVTFSVWKAILVGWLFVNVPVIVIMLGVLLIGVMIEPRI